MIVHYHVAKRTMKPEWFKSSKA